MQQALIISRDEHWPAASGVAGMLAALGLAAQVRPAFPGEALACRVVLVRYDAGTPPPGGTQAQHTLTGEIWLGVSAAPLAAVEDIDGALVEPVTLTALATELSRHGYCPMDDTEAADACAALDTLSGGDPEASAELAQSVLDANRADLAALLGASTSRFWGEAAACAHRLKGSLRLAGSAGGVAVAGALEAAARAGDGPACAALVPLVAAAVERLDSALAQ